METVAGPTPWISLVVLVSNSKNPLKLEYVLIQGQLTKQFSNRDIFDITPIIDEIIVRLNGAKVFSKLDLNQGYL